jgi:glycerate kinase
MRVLIAPDKFKGSLSALSVANNIAIGFQEISPDAEIELAPIADGGEGTVEVINVGRGGEWVSCAAHDALGNEITARYVWIKDDATAVMEMSEAAGARHLVHARPQPLRANTFGVGEMLRNAAEYGAREIILGLGGSMTNDGGSGLARALGFQFFAGDDELKNGPAELEKLTRIVPPSCLSLPAIIAAVDVRNPLLGERGATRVFGPQKGVRPDQVPILESALKRLADTVARDMRCDFRDEPGAGAAGGLGFGLMSFCAAHIRSGFSVVAEAIRLEEKIGRADIVITGEGRLDWQTLEGKGPAGVAKLAREHGKAVYAIVGQADHSSSFSDCFDGLYELARPPISEAEAIKFAAELLRQRARELASAVAARR